MPNFPIVGSEIVGPVVGEELTRKGIWATVLSLLGILIYIGVRFQISFGVGAIVATIHDLLVTMAFLAFFRYRPQPERDCGDPDDYGLFDERHDRHLRSCA